MSSIFEQQYKTLLNETLKQGELCENRTGVKTYKQFNKCSFFIFDYTFYKTKVCQRLKY